MSLNCKLDQDVKGKVINLKLYKAMIGLLLCLTASKSDIMFCICMYACYQSNLKESHVITVERFF